MNEMRGGGEGGGGGEKNNALSCLYGLKLLLTEHLRSLLQSKELIRKQYIRCVSAACQKLLLQIESCEGYHSGIPNLGRLH